MNCAQTIWDKFKMPREDKENNPSKGKGQNNTKHFYYFKMNQMTCTFCNVATVRCASHHTFN